MEAALVHRDNLPSKRSRAQMQDDRIDSLNTEHAVDTLKRSHTEREVLRDRLDDFPRLLQECPSYACRAGSKSRSGTSEIETARIRELRKRGSGPYLEACLERRSGEVVGDSRSDYFAPCQKSHDNSSSADERAASACQFEYSEEGRLQPIDNWFADDALADIACFLESWDDSIGETLSGPQCLFEDDDSTYARLNGDSDVLSTVDGVGEGDWCLNDVAAEAERQWSEPSEKEWVGVAVPSNNRFSNNADQPMWR